MKQGVKIALIILFVLSAQPLPNGGTGSFSTFDRAFMALMSGADLVLGMPVSYSCAQANRFATGGIGILNALGVVSHLSFGIEKESLPYLYQVSDMLAKPGLTYLSNLKAGLNKGKSFARSQGEALAHELPDFNASILNQPNFNLGISYLQALSELKSTIKPVPVIRQGSYHDTELSAYPSASAVRSAIFRKDWSSVEAAVPPCVYQIIIKMAQNHHFHLPDALDKVLLTKLIDGEDFSRIAEISEGLDLRMLKFSKLSSSRSQLIELMKTKRYPYARISRVLTQSLLGIENQLPRPPDYARLLGFRKSTQPLLHAIGKSGFRLISRPAQCLDHEIGSDMRAEQLWYIGSGQPAANAFKQKMIII